MYPRFLAALMVAGAICPARVQANSSASHRDVNRIQAYTVEFKSTLTRTLSNGTIITRESTRVDAVDSQSRSLISETEAAAFNAHDTWTRGHVSDPTNDTLIDWNSREHKATVTHLPGIPERHGCWDDDTGNHQNFGGEGPRTESKPSIQRPAHDDQELTSEDLGTMTIAGMEVQGHRRTQTIPAGKWGNDRPIVISSESWVAPSLGGLELRRVVDDPMNGTTRTELTRLDLSEPPLATFQPPDGYEVVHIELHKVACPNR
jgi:hypothetical protein